MGVSVGLSVGISVGPSVGLNGNAICVHRVEATRERCFEIRRKRYSSHLKDITYNESWFSRCGLWRSRLNGQI